MSFRIEKDSMGEVHVPKEAYYGAQTQRAADNFPISALRFSSPFISALGLIKATAASVNADLGLLDASRANAIMQAAQEVADGKLDDHFVLDIFQTGSGTSTNMNANEVISRRANELLEASGAEERVHPNDHVNMGQSSNDTIPTAIRLSTVLQGHRHLLPAIDHLRTMFLSKGKEYAKVVKTGRTHLMDAMPVTIEQEFGGYARQLELAHQRLTDALARNMELPQGGTAVGTGINTHPEFGVRFAKGITEATGIEFIEAVNHFEAQATVDASVELSGQCKTLAVSLIKMANDLRWMNSGPNGGLAEVQLQALQPGSSIMPGKVNPVIEESVIMVALQVLGNDTTISVAGQTGNFELNVALPVVGHNLLESIHILGTACQNFADRSVQGLTVRVDKIAENVSKNPILVTALNAIIGYDLAAKIAKKAFAEDRPLIDVAEELTDLSRSELETILNPTDLTRPGIASS